MTILQELSLSFPAVDDFASLLLLPACEPVCRVLSVGIRVVDRTSSGTILLMRRLLLTFSQGLRAARHERDLPRLTGMAAELRLAS
jgi:hypothetical protein